MDQKNKSLECCPKFNKEPWDEKILNWQNKKFVKSRVITFLNIPLNFGGVMKKLTTEIEKAGVKTPEQLCLSDHVSKWWMEIFIAVEKEVPGLENVTLSGQFLSKVYEGDFQKTGEWCEDFNKFAKSKNLEIEKWYMWYTTCPKCAKKYGKNYTVIICKIKNHE